MCRVRAHLCPGGTPENSPPIYRWVYATNLEVPVGTAEAGDVSRPYRDFGVFRDTPTDKSVGYYQASLRDFRNVLAKL
jgi:hypothetical protein